MARKVTGFMADDGTFFPSKVLADAHDRVVTATEKRAMAERGLRIACSEQTKPVNSDSFINFIEAMAEETTRYLNANEEYHEALTSQSRVEGDARQNSPELGGNQSDD